MDIIVRPRLALIYPVTSILQTCIKLLYDYAILIRFTLKIHYQSSVYKLLPLTQFYQSTVGSPLNIHFDSLLISFSILIIVHFILSHRQRGQIAQLLSSQCFTTITLLLDNNFSRQSRCSSTGSKSIVVGINNIEAKLDS